MTETLRQLVYISKATVPISAAELASIAARSEHRNHEAGLGGALLYGRGLFLQALEGEPGAIDTVYARIQLDARHTDVRTLVDHLISRRAFRKWAMTPVCIDDGESWTLEHARAVESMASVASVVPPGSAAHTLMGYFGKHIPRLAA